MPRGIAAPLEERFWAMVDRGGPDDCWAWKGSTNNAGYGHIGVDSERHKDAHRASWELSNGPIPDGLFVLHHCDNPSCVNPKHLHLGTQADNLQECVERGRFPVGEEIHASKLTKGDVKAIRELYCTGAFGQRELAQMFGVVQQTISSIVNRKSWKHVYQSEETDGQRPS